MAAPPEPTRSVESVSSKRTESSDPAPSTAPAAASARATGGRTESRSSATPANNSATTGAVDSSATTGAAENFGYIFAFSCAPDDFAETRGLFESIARTISVEPEQRQKMKELLDSLQKHDEVMNKHFPKH